MKEDIHMAKQTKQEFTITLVTGPDGTVDREESMAAAAIALDDYLAAQEAMGADVSSAVHTVFDRYPGASLGVPFVVRVALEVLKATPANNAILDKSIHAYLTANGQGDKREDGSVPNPDSLFLINKGKGGGCKRRSDIKPTA
jgi:hypothetical protein